MKTILSAYDWSTVKINDVFRVGSGPAGTKITGEAQTGFYQFGMKMSGDTNIFYNGKEIDFCSGSVLYIPKENHRDIDYHKTIINAGESICIFFDSDVPLPAEPILIKCDDRQINNLFAEFNEVFNKVGVNYFDYIGYFYHILSVLNRTLNSRAMRKIDAMPEVIAYMEECLTDSYIDFRRIAKKYDISYDLFRHKFKEVYNLSPLQYYHRLKTDYIKVLIRENDYSLGEIARMTGFSEFNYFSRFFKKNAGVTLTEYKKQIGLIYNNLT